MPSAIRFPGAIVIPRIRRRFLLEPAEVGVYHCINLCVKRSFLFGTDPICGKNYDHRRQWIQDVVLKNRPDVVQNWSNAEVARRW